MIASHAHVAIDRAAAANGSLGAAVGARVGFGHAVVATGSLGVAAIAIGAAP
jgi:hypothetical protein